MRGKFKSLNYFIFAGDFVCKMEGCDKIGLTPYGAATARRQIFEFHRIKYFIDLKSGDEPSPLHFLWCTENKN